MKRDIHWLLEQAPKNPGRVYPMTDGFEYQWEPGDGLQYRCNGGGWVNMHIISDTLSATFAEAEPDVDSREWACRQMDDGWIVQCPAASNTLYTKIDGELRDSEDGGKAWEKNFGELCTCSHHQTGWVRVRKYVTEPSPDGHDWLRSLEDGAEVEHDRYGSWYVKRGTRLAMEGSDRVGGSISEYPDSGWRRREKPAAGSREAVAASKEGACWWKGDVRKYYFRRYGRGLQTVNTLTGEVELLTPEIDEHTVADGWSPVLDSSGNPAEPVVHSQLWAQICCRELGREVASKWGERYRWNKARGRFEFLRSNGEWQDLGDSGNLLNIESPKACQSGWSLYVAPDPLLVETEALLARVRERIGKGVG